MPIRFRITLLFTISVFVLLGIVCGAIYYLSYSYRESNLRKRLTNRAITTARFLGQKELFDRELILRIDSSTTISLQHKTIQAYNHQNRKIYSYSDRLYDTLHVEQDVIDRARENGRVFYQEGNREVIAYHEINGRGSIVVVSAAEDRDGNAWLSLLGRILVACFVAGTGIAFAGGFLVSRRLLRPITDITSEVKEISANNLSRRIQPGPTKDEWHHLSITLNDLLDRLKESFELQRRFIANASHELSTPLTLISSQLEVALQRNRSEEAYREVMKTVVEDVRNMNNLVQELLKFATAAGNPGGLNIELVRIDEIVMRLPGAMQKQDKASVVTLQFEELPEEEDKLLVFGNEELLYSAIRNICSNACKYSDDKRAEISLQVTDSHFTIRISDNGIGITEDELKNIFQPFYRVDADNSAKGFGLGLSLASRIIKMHKGSIHVESTPGKGTDFFITLPAASMMTSGLSKTD